MNITPEQRQQWREDAEHEAAQRPISAYDSQAIYRILALLDAIDAAEAEAMNLSHDYDRRGERLWRLAAKAGWTPHEADNDATAELWVADALAALDRVRALAANDCPGCFEPDHPCGDALCALKADVRAALDGGVA